MCLELEPETTFCNHDPGHAPSRGQLRTKRLQQTFASILTLIDNALEAFIATEIRIDDDAAVIARAKLHQEPDFVAMLRWTRFFERDDVGVVHGNDQVEALEIGCGYLSATKSGQVVAAFFRYPLGALIGRLANVPVSGSR